MSAANVEVVKSLYAAFAAGDGAAAVATMDPGIVWNEAENFVYADRNPYIGPAAIAEGVFIRCGVEWDDFKAIPAEILDAGDAIIALGRYTATARSTGIPINAQFAHVYRLRDGKITNMQQYTDTLQAMRAYAP